jgi:hypothetical protein
MAMDRRAARMARQMAGPSRPGNIQSTTGVAIVGDVNGKVFLFEHLLDQMAQALVVFYEQNPQKSPSMSK